MKTEQLKIINKLGLHARAAAKLVSLASQFHSEVHVSKDGKQVNAKSIMGVMMLAASQHTIINISADGEDEEQAVQEIKSLVDDRFGEME
ncbi:MAG: HPr family phosphocarrier protein [Gammaproteobacteria bacterium]|nr:HPr family phosphocarrier protein [Gammaproteobacteria bacterium]